MKLRACVMLGAMALCFAASASFAEGVGTADVTVNVGSFHATGDLPAAFVLDTRVARALWGPLRAGCNLGFVSGSDQDFVLHAQDKRAGSGGLPLSYHLSNANTDLFPLYAQLAAAYGSGRVVSEIGVGGGYQMLFVAADAFQTEIFGGWGGTGRAGAYYDLRPDNPELFVGIGIEAAVDAGKVRRDTFDRVLAIPVRQEIDTAGWSVCVAARLAWRRAAAPAAAAR